MYPFNMKKQIIPIVFYIFSSKQVFSWLFEANRGDYNMAILPEQTFFP
jgi:hypothetical protein